MSTEPVCWSTGDVVPRKSLEYWNRLFAEKLLPLEISSQARSHFVGRMIGASLGQAQVYHVSAESDQKVDHGRACVAQRRDDSLCLVHLRSGGFHFETKRRSADLRPGDCVILDSKQQFRFSLPNASSALVVRTTAAWMRRWMPDFEDVAGIRIDGGCGWGQALSHALWNIDPMQVAELPLPGAVVADQLGGLLTLAVGTRLPASTGCDRLWQRVRSAMRDSYLVDDLDPGLLAARVGISKRYLHKLCARAGTTFRRELQDLRIAEGERLLMQSRGRRLSVTEIALACGFYDASHFARQFRMRHGMTPGAYRAALPGQAKCAPMTPSGKRVGPPGSK